MYPYFLFTTIHHPKSSPTFSVRPHSSVGRVTVDLIRRSWVWSPPRSKDFFFTSCGSLIPFYAGANTQWVIHGSMSTLIYTSELILCSTTCVHSATRHNVHMYLTFSSPRFTTQWVIHGFNEHFNLHFRVNSLFHHLSWYTRTLRVDVSRKQNRSRDFLQDVNWQKYRATVAI